MTAVRLGFLGTPATVETGPDMGGSEEAVGAVGAGVDGPLGAFGPCAPGGGPAAAGARLGSAIPGTYPSITGGAGSRPGGTVASSVESSWVVALWPGA